MLRPYRDEGLSLGVAFGVPVGDVDVVAVHRWLDAGTPLSEIARQVGRPAGAIRRALRDAGLPVPPSRPPLDLDVIRVLYWQDGLSLAKIAARLGCSAARVGSAMRAAGIPRRDAHDRAVRPGPWWVTREELTALYVARALTARQVATELGCDPAWVTAALRRYRIARPVDPVRLDVDRATLTRLYVTERLDDPQIAARYGVPVWRVTRRRRELDVHRPRTRHPDPPTPDLPAAGADEHFAAADPTGDPALATLHADPEIAAWLRRHQIPRHPATPGGGPAGPGPVELTRPLLQQAYQHIGLSAPQIGALTGRATGHVIRALHTHGIPVHGDPATSPWQNRRNASRRANRRPQ